MLNVKSIVVQALESNSSLVALLGGEKVFFMTNSEDTELPYITYQEIVNIDDSYYDNKATSSEIQLVINIWSEESTTKIAQEVDKSMKSLQFKRVGSVDLYHEDVGIFHKNMRYKTNKII